MNYLDPSDYGEERKKRSLYQFPQFDAKTPPFIEEPPSLDPPTPPPSMTAPPTLDTPKLPSRWTSQDQAAETDRGSDAALERYKELASKQPKLEYKKGALGVLQRIGDAVVRPDVMHPNFTRETENYNRDLDAQGKVVKAAGAMADDARKRAAYESDLSRNQKQEALYGRQMETEQRRQDALDNPRAQAVGTFGYYDRDGKWHDAPVKPTKIGTAHYVTAQDGSIVAVTQNEDGTFSETPLKSKGKPMKQGGGNGGDGRAPQNAFRVIESSKNAKMLAVKKEAQKAEAKAAADVAADFSVPPAQKQAALQALKAQIWANYEDQMEQIQTGYESEIVSAGGNVSPRGSAPSAPSAPAAPKDPLGLFSK